MALLKVLGLWAPDTENQKIQILYTIWSYFYRGFFLYTYTFMQIMFFKDVEDIAVNFKRRPKTLSHLRDKVKMVP